MTTSRGPLERMRVIELVGIGPGPFAAMLLADLGAEVIRVDRPGGGLTPVDPERDVLGRGRSSVTLDLKDPASVQTVLRMVSEADALLEGFRPGVAERLGLGPDDCLAVNPGLVYGRITGWGQSGPLAHTAGHDINYLSISGTLGLIGRRGGPPQIPLNLLGDFASGSLYLVTGMLAALLEARDSGVGQVVDAAIVDGAAHLQAMITAMRAADAWTDERGTNLLDSGAPFYDVYETADGKFMAVGAIEPQFYRQLLAGLELRDAADRDDPRNWPELRSQISARFTTRTRAHWQQVFEGTDACVTPVLNLGEAITHPHNVARATYQARGDAPEPVAAPRFSLHQSGIGGPPRRPGQDTDDILARWGAEGATTLD